MSIRACRIRRARAWKKIWLSLEGGVAARVFASGMAAINAIVSMLKSGDHVVCGNDLYGGTPRLFNQVMTGFGLEFSYVDTSEAQNVERAIRKNTRMVYVETPTNPLMRLSDLVAISQICRRKKVALVVDNTFMSPYFQQPVALRGGYGRALDHEISERAQRRTGWSGGLREAGGCR